MKILAIETSCDETSIAIIVTRKQRAGMAIRVLSHLVSSQAALHAAYGGVVPNLARREHERNVPILLKRGLRENKLFKISKFQFPNSKHIQNLKLQKIVTILEREQELFEEFKKEIISLSVPDIDVIAVTHGPGLAPALWVGVNFARALAVLWDKPLIPVNHMEGHLFSALLTPHPVIPAKAGIQIFKNAEPGFRIKSGMIQKEEYKIQKIKFPALALLVSGGHTELVLMRGYGKYKIVGETLDDAAGEAFDKVARILGLGYPGGPLIAAEAIKIKNEKRKMKNDNETLKVKLPRPMINSKDFNFSFSGLKTAVLYLTRDLGKTKTRKLRSVIAKEFQDAVVEVLVAKTIGAAKKYCAKTVLLGGGVAANAVLRMRLKDAITQECPDTQMCVPALALTGDNAFMIAAAAAVTGKKKAPTFEVRAEPNARLDKIMV